MISRGYPTPLGPPCEISVSRIRRRSRASPTRRRAATGHDHSVEVLGVDERVVQRALRALEL